jgi:magnesium-transporting ATPase (P-type)
MDSHNEPVCLPKKTFNRSKELTMKKSFSWRIFTSFGLLLSFIMLLVSGVLLYIFPGGRGQRIVWELLGLGKPAWQNQHIIFGFAFSLLSLCHLFFINWSAFLSYLKSKTKVGLQSPLELIVIAALSFFFFLGTYHKIEPFSSILEFGKTISKSYEGTQTEQQGPERFKNENN